MSAERKDDVVRDLASLRDRYRPKPPGGPGGGDPEDPMEARVAALEADRKAIFSKLDEIGKAIGDARLENEKRFSAIDTKLTGMDGKLETKASSEVVTRIAGEIGARLVGVEGKLDAKANATDMAAVKGAVEKLPTTWQIMGPMAALIFATLGGVAALAVTLYKLFAPAAGP